ncbi:L-threonylcarbamoyladenylate synthase [Methylosoma difficile]
MQIRLADADALAAAVQLLQQGRLVAFPTETVYGLGADAANPEAVRRIFAAKGRPADHPLIVHIGDLSGLNTWAQHIPDAAYQLAEQFWPGPLAIILPKQAQVPLEVTGGQQTVGLRMPSHPVALQLLQAFGGGIAAPSANRYCRISPTLASHVAEELGDAVDLILDGGACQVGVESTIVDLSGAQPNLLRPGQISRAAIESVLGESVLVAAASQVRTSGMMDVHYAPATRAVLCATDDLADAYRQLTAQGKKVGLMVWQAQTSPANTQILMPLAADVYAQALYASLRKLDSLQLDVILVEQPPVDEAWRAVNDRLGKATVRLS